MAWNITNAVFRGNRETLTRSSTVGLNIVGN